MIEQSVKEADCSYIILSGYDEFRLAKDAIRLGVTEYLLKPLEQEQLSAALERAKGQLEMKRQYNAMLTSGAASGEALQASVVKLPGKSSRYVSRMIRYVQEHYAEKIGIKDLVESLGVSATYLNQKFKSETTYTFNDFLNRYRIQKAMDLLRSRDDKVYAIAANVGYKDYKYFIAIFKKYAGCTPSSYQERYGRGQKDGEASADAKQAD